MSYTANMTWGTLSTSTSNSFFVPMTTDPFLQGQGPAECSTCTELAVVPVYIFDVNGYYRDLGLDPNAKPTRRQLREAYSERDGMHSERLTYVLKMLLNPEVRKTYDALPLGLRLFDKYEHEAMNRKVKTEQSRRMAEAALRGQHVSERTEREMLRDLWRERGFDIDDAGPDEADTPDDVVDQDPPAVLDRPDPAEDPNQFNYAYYLWRTNLTSREQLGRLARWQEHLVSAFAQRGARIQLSVGLHGHMVSPSVSARVGYREVFFLHCLETPTAELAQRMADQWLQDHNPSQTREIES